MRDRLQHKYTSGRAHRRPCYTNLCVSRLQAAQSGSTGDPPGANNFTRCPRKAHPGVPTPPSHIAPMQRRINTEVLIVGAGPVGLSLAMDLARRGVGVSLVEMRTAGELPSVRCNHVSARTMETFRRLGIARAVRDAGFPPTTLTTSPFAPRPSASRWRAFQFRVVPSVTERKTVPTPGGQRLSRRIALIRSILSRCCLRARRQRPDCSS